MSCVVSRVLATDVSSVSFVLKSHTRSVSSMLPFNGGTVVRNYMIFMCYTVLQCTLAGHNTLDAFFTVLVWSLMACKEGKWPHFMPNGDPVTGRWAQMAGYAWTVFIKQTRATIRIRIWDPPSFFLSR